MLTDKAVNPAASEQAPIYFAVSATKLILLSVFSFGVYELYWFHWQWTLEKARTGEKLSPFWRAFFAPIFAYSLFKRIKAFADSSSLPINYSPGWLAAAFVGLAASWRLPDPVWLISFLTFLPLLPVRAAVASINLRHSPHSDKNGAFSGANIILLLAGGLLSLLAVVDASTP